MFQYLVVQYLLFASHGQLIGGSWLLYDLIVHLSGTFPMEHNYSPQPNALVT